MHCVVPENVHPSPTEETGNSRGVGGSKFRPINLPLEVPKIILGTSRGRRGQTKNLFLGGGMDCTE